MKSLALMLEERTLAVLVLAGGIFTGLAVPEIADFLRPWALPSLFLVVIFSLVPFARLSIRKLTHISRGSVRIVAWQQVVLPCIVISCGVLARVPDAFVFLVVVTACSGSLFSSPALAELLHLDGRRALQVMVLSTVFMPLSLFMFIDLYAGMKAVIDVEAYALRTFVFLVVPFLLLCAYRPMALRMSSVTSERVERASRWTTILALLIFGTGLMSAVSDKLQDSPAKVLFMLFLATSLCVLMMVLTAIVMHRFGQSEAMTASIVAGFRNIGLGFALVGEGIGNDLACYAGVSLLPIFTAPLVIRLFFTPQKAVGGAELQTQGALWKRENVALDARIMNLSPRRG